MDSCDWKEVCTSLITLTFFNSLFCDLTLEALLTTSFVRPHSRSANRFNDSDWNITLKFNRIGSAQQLFNTSISITITLKSRKVLYSSNIGGVVGRNWTTKRIQKFWEQKVFYLHAHVHLEVLAVLVLADSAILFEFHSFLANVLSEMLNKESVIV